MDGGTGGFHLMSWLEEYERIIMIDATLDNNPPGTVRLIKPRYASDFPPLMSAHEIGLRDMIEAMMLTGKMPEIQLIVISAADVSEVGMDLSQEVKAAIPEVISMVKELL
jgi:hydrogenase maturation protease